MELSISPTLDVFGLIADFDWRAYQDGRIDEVKKIDSLLQKIMTGIENRNRGLIG